MGPKRFPKKFPSGKNPPIARLTLNEVRSNEPITEASTSAVAANDEVQSTYEEELAWCIHNIKTSLSTKQLTSKQAEDAAKNLHILESPREPLVKKRCLMKTVFGNYRQKIEKEKQKVALNLQNARINPQPVASTSGQFVRKSHLAETENGKFSFQTSDNSFRFNFSAE